jgi:hypothetical protein
MVYAVHDPELYDHPVSRVSIMIAGNDPFGSRGAEPDPPSPSGLRRAQNHHQGRLGEPAGAGGRRLAI